MTKKWIAINLLLLAVAGLLGRQLYLAVARFNADNDLAKIQPVQDLKQKVTPEKAPARLPPPAAYAAADYAVIAEKNVFTESRSKEEKVESAAQVETPPLMPKPVLVGVTLSESEQTAAIVDPSEPAARTQTRRAQIKRVGDFYRGYKITSITLDNIVLESGTRREIIPLHEGSKGTQGGKTPIVATRVVPIGSSGAGAGSIPVSIVARQAGATRTSSAPGQPPTAAASQPVAVQTIVAQPRQGAATAQPQTQEQPETRTPPAVRQQVPATGGTEAPRGRVVRTPFGDIIRPDRN
jgi:hypothetical protein